MDSIFYKYDDLFVHNEYFDRYVELCSRNKLTEKKKFKTQTHHIIPKSYFKLKSISIDNSNENLVELSHKDHAIAHYLLCKCVTENFIYQNEYALLFMLNRHKIKLDCVDDSVFDELASEYNNVYEDFCKRQSKNKLGNIPWNKGGNCYNDEQISNMRNSHIGKKLSDETKEKMRVSSYGKNSGGIYVNNGKVSKHISEDELDEYLSYGWVIGQIQHHKNTFLGYITITDGENEKRIKKDDFCSYEKDGWVRGRSNKSKEKNSKSHLGKSSWNKGIKWTEEQKQTFISPFKSKKYWVSNGIERHRVAEEDVQKYLDFGFVRGMK